MILKQVKEYSQRQRINLNKSDGFQNGDEVVILPREKYQELQAYKNELEILKNQEQNLKQIIKDITAPIYENHQKELEIKDKEIKQLKMELKRIEAKTNQYNLELQGLNIIEILFLRKHKELIKKYHDDVLVLTIDQKTIDTKPSDMER